MSKNYIVCGGISGIGKELCQQLIAAGHQITLFDLAEPDFEVKQFVSINLQDTNAIDAAVAQLADAQYDGLFNIAGLPPRENLTQIILEVNFQGTRYLTDKLLGKINNGGAIVNLASKAGGFWQQNLEQVKQLLAIDIADQAGLEAFISDNDINHIRSYNLSKEAVIVWSKQLSAQLLERNIRVISISPAAVETGILADFATAFGDKMKANTAIVGRSATVTEIANVTRSVMSDEYSWVNGIDIQIDGGAGAYMFNQQLHA